MNFVGHVNWATEEYQSGENYYQKFGGTHRSCDIFRSDPCKYAPMLTPSLSSLSSSSSFSLQEFATTTTTSMVNPINWKVYINNCDATWVGTATVEALRALRNADGTAIFTLVNGTTLHGTIYSQAVKPSDWTNPSKGVVTSETRYEINLKFKNTITVDVEEEANTHVRFSNSLNEHTPSLTLQPSTSTATLTSVNNTFFNLSAARVETQEEKMIKLMFSYERFLLANEVIALSSDIQFASGKDPRTNERLYAYVVLLFPYRNINNEIVHVDTDEVMISSISLLNTSWTSPNQIECPHCTGTRNTCIGTGNVFETNCGNDALMSFEAMNSKIFDFDEGTINNSAFLPSTSLGDQTYYNISFMVRANGHDSANSADSSPVGVFYLRVAFVNGQTFTVAVNQTDYVSEINARYLDAKVCRASAYWPVADPFGTSLPIHPYDAQNLAHINNNNDNDDDDKDDDDKSNSQANLFSGPSSLSSATECEDAEVHANNTPYTEITSLTSQIMDGNRTINASMCAMRNEHTFGVSDWVTLSFPFSYKETRDINNEMSQIIIDTPTLDNASFTTAELEYLVLSVRAEEVIESEKDASYHKDKDSSSTDDAGKSLSYNASNVLLNILLDGNNPPQETFSEEERWMTSTLSPSKLHTMKEHNTPISHVSKYNINKVHKVVNDNTLKESKDGSEDEHGNVFLEEFNNDDAVATVVAATNDDDDDDYSLTLSETSSTVKFYNWKTYASALNYRRIKLEFNSSRNDSAIAVEPFRFAFIPGSLLHSESSVRVPMYLTASIKFTTYARQTSTSGDEPKVVKVDERQEKLYYILSISRSISAKIRFDTDTYTPKLVTIHTGGLGRRSATALLIILFIAVIAVMAGSIYVEVTYKRLIHNAKYHPRRPDSAIGVHYGRDGKPKDRSSSAHTTAADNGQEPQSEHERGNNGEGSEASDDNDDYDNDDYDDEQGNTAAAVTGTSSHSQNAPHGTSRRRRRDESHRNNGIKTIYGRIRVESSRVAHDDENTTSDEEQTSSVKDFTRTGHNKRHHANVANQSPQSPDDTRNENVDRVNKVRSRSQGKLRNSLPLGQIGEEQERADKGDEIAEFEQQENEQATSESAKPQEM